MVIDANGYHMICLNRTALSSKDAPDGAEVASTARFQHDAMPILGDLRACDCEEGRVAVLILLDREYRPEVVLLVMEDTSSHHC